MLRYRNVQNELVTVYITVELRILELLGTPYFFFTYFLLPALLYLYCYEKELNIFHSKIDSKKVFKKSRCPAGLFHVQKDAGSDDENVVVDTMILPKMASSTLMSIGG